MTFAKGSAAARNYIWFAVALIAILIAARARADTPAAAPAAAPTPAPASYEELEQRIRVLERKLEIQEETQAAVAADAPVVKVGPKGFALQSKDGANQIRFRSELDVDGRFFNDNSTPVASRDTWLLRRARPIIEGTLSNIFDFRITPDFGGGKTVVQDAYIAARFRPYFTVTAGKFKEPFGLERLQSSPDNRLIELGLPSDLVPNRDIGVQISGAVFDGALTYQIGYFNGVTDGVSADANATPDVDNNDDKDVAARVFTTPFASSDIFALRGLGVGFAVGYVNQIGDATNTLLPTYKTETQRNLFGYDAARTASGAAVAATPTIANGGRLRWSPQAYYYLNSFGLLTEYVRVAQDVSRTFGSGATAFTRSAKLNHDSWQILATYLLTGDDAGYKTVVPKTPFAIGKPGWGAVELAGRYSVLTVDDATFINRGGAGAKAWFADPTKQPSQAKAWTLGVNWYLTQNLEWVLNYTVTDFNGGAVGADRLPEKAFFTRFQVAY